MSTAAPVDALDREQLHEGFVNQFRRRKGVAGSLASKPIPCNAAQLGVHQRQDSLQSGPVSAGMRLQQVGNRYARMALSHG